MNYQDQLFKKVKDIAKTTKDELKSKGVVIPTTDENGGINFNSFKVLKTDEGFYAIFKKDEKIVDKINLPQTAIVIANKLALGQWVDKMLLSHDTAYGYNTFEEEQYQRLTTILISRKDWTRVDAIRAKSVIAQQKAHVAKKAIMRSYEKLQYQF